MKSILPGILEECRIRQGPMASCSTFELNGAFVIPGPCGRRLAIISSNDDGTGWEHVSVSTPKHPPNWQEMCFVKNLFWDPEECVMQLHPPESEYVNCHPNCLHLWKPVNEQIPMPDSILVGPKRGTIG